MTDIAAAMLGSSALSAVGNALGISSSEDAAREANELQYKMFREQLGFNHNERLEIQRYNSPQEQRKRFEAAGINPYAMLGNMEAGNVNAAVAPAANPAHMPNTTPSDYARLGESLGEGFLRASQLEALNLDNSQKRIELQYKTAHELLSLQNEAAEIVHKGVSSAVDRKRLEELNENISMLKENLDILRANKPELKKQEIARTKSMELENSAKDLHNQYQKLMNDLQSKLAPGQLKLLQAQIFQAIQSGNASSAEAAVKHAEEKGVKIDNYQKNKINWLIREGVRLENKRKDYDARYPAYFESQIIEPAFRFMQHLPWNAKYDY